MSAFKTPLIINLAPTEGIAVSKFFKCFASIKKNSRGNFQLKRVWGIPCRDSVKAVSEIARA